MNEIVSNLIKSSKIIDIQIPAESPRVKDHSNDENYLLIVLLEQDTSEILKLNRIYVFKDINQIKDWLKNNFYDSAYVIPDNSMIVFQTRGWMEYFANIFWARNFIDYNINNIKRLEK